MRYVHYMVRRPDRLGELIYPAELPELPYQGYGSFFLDGLPDADLETAYRFYVVRDEELLAVDLQRVGNVSFDAVVDGIGRFRFRATTTGVPARYSGDYPFPYGNLLVRQLAPSNRIALERAAFEHKFYFAGYSPMIGVSTPYDLDHPPEGKVDP